MEFFINFYKAFSSLSSFFYFYSFLRVKLDIIITVSIIMIDQILLCNVFFSVLILVLNKVASFHNEAHIFLYQKSLAPIFLTLPMGVL